MLTASPYLHAISDRFATSDASLPGRSIPRFMTRLAWATFLMLVVFASTVPRSVAQGPENTLLVVNQDEPSSLLLANHYQHMRNIPAQNVLYLGDIPQREEVGLELVKKKIFEPILAHISQSKIGDHIECIVYSSGFPTIVNASPHRKRLTDLLKEHNQPAPPSRVLNPKVSLTSATYFFRKVMADDPTYLSLNANWFMSRTGVDVLKTPFFAEQQEEYQTAVDFYERGEYETALQSFKEMASQHPLQVALHYWIARCHARLKQDDAAIESLIQAVRTGWSYRERTRRDAAFATLQENALFRAVLKKTPDLDEKTLPTRSFRADVFWGRNGFPNGNRNGESYVLSTMLAVTRNQGISERDALAYLVRSVRADATSPTGTFYFADTKDVRTRTRKPGFTGALRELAQLRQKAEIIKAPVPRGKPDVMGAQLGAPSVNWKASGSTILPGGIVENLTSYGGMFKPGTSQTKLTEFLRHGAAGSSGTVIEPFALQAKFPHPRLYVHYARGATLAEAFYQSVEGPFQLLIMGDALCRPFAHPPKMNVVSSAGDQPVTGSFQLKFASTDDSPPVSLYEIYVDGRRMAQTNQPRTMRVDTSTWPDGWHELRVVARTGSYLFSKSTWIGGVVVRNQDRQVTASCADADLDIGDTVSVEAVAPGADRILIKHNSRVLDTKAGEQATFEIPALRLGRGPTTVHVIGRFGDQDVLARPIELEVNGPISDELPQTEEPFRPRKTPANQKKPGKSKS